jgi:hypothetical protein
MRRSPKKKTRINKRSAYSTQRLRAGEQTSINQLIVKTNKYIINECFSTRTYWGWRIIRGDMFIPDYM